MASDPAAAEAEAAWLLPPLKKLQKRIKDELKENVCKLAPPERKWDGFSQEEKRKVVADATALVRQFLDTDVVAKEVLGSYRCSITAYMLNGAAKAAILSESDGGGDRVELDVRWITGQGNTTISVLIHGDKRACGGCVIL
eukprot:TRINITY_DN23503_c0_g1_i1.p1 TRINITY_DN23503_c0_g1~~TRINITY_DN23503_c0_g1_i1.p1  ORF type:complete len:141 (+),score=46.90 TRINITY_DN23503_c0_g1_i1:183-605(+)